MDFNNNPIIKPIGEDVETKQHYNGFNPMEILTDRVNGLEKTVEDYQESFETKRLNVLNGGDVKLTNLEVTETLGNPNLMNTSPIESENVVGYDENGNLIPIHAVYDTGTPIYTPQNAQFLGTDSDRRLINRVLYDYIVDSQEKFDDLITLAKTVGGVTYKDIAIIGGKGDGDNGEYICTIDSDTVDTQFNNANIYSYESPKINVVLSSVDSDNINVFKGINSFDKIDVDLSGTIVDDTVITLFADSKLKNFTFNNTDEVENITIDNCKLENVVNNGYTVFTDCTLKDCDTVQSSFDTCTSEMLYVDISESIEDKFVFKDCGIHLDIRPSSSSVTVNMEIASLTNTKLTCLDKTSTQKSLIIYCDACDVYSRIVGNNDSPNKVTYKPFNAIDVEVDDDNIENVCIIIGDMSKTPVYYVQGEYQRAYYLDESHSADKQVHRGQSINDENVTFGYYVGDDSSTWYKDLSLTEIQPIGEEASSSFIDYFDYMLSNKADKTYYNDTEVKMYIQKGESSGTILYSKDNGTTMYLDNTCNQEINIYVNNDDTTGTKPLIYVYNQFVLSDSLNFDEKEFNAPFQQTTFSPLEITLKNQDEYAVQVISTHGDYMNVKDAYFIQKFQGE